MFFIFFRYVRLILTLFSLTLHIQSKGWAEYLVEFFPLGSPHLGGAAHQFCVMEGFLFLSILLIIRLLSILTL